MYYFGVTSLNRLQTADNELKILANTVIKILDHSIVTGFRTKAEQDKLYPRFSTVQWPNSKHNKYPSQAIDVAPYIRPYGALFGSPEQIKQIQKEFGVSRLAVNEFILKAYARLIGAYEMASHIEKIPIRVGMDWDGDFDMLDQTFHDLGHIELA